MSAINHDFPVGVEARSETGDVTPASTDWLDRFSVVTKIRGAVIGIALALTALSATILGVSYYISRDGNVTDQLRRTQVMLGQASMAIADAREDMREVDADALRDAKTELKTSIETLTFVLEQGVDMPQEVRTKVDDFRVRSETLSEQLNNLRPGNRGARDAASARQDISAIHGDIRAYSSELHLYVEQRTERMFAMIGTGLAFLLSLLVIVPVIAFFFARKVVHNVAGTVVEITESMQRISRGEIEAAIPGRERQDEIGAMARALAIFRDTARRELNRQRELDEERVTVREEKAAALRKLAASFEESVGDVATSIGAASAQLQTSASTMAGNAELTQQQTAESAAAMSDSSSGVAAAASASDEFALSISEVSRQAAASAELARGASLLATEANTAIGALSEDAVEIGEIVELIQSIAQRTNLLALNASIEAARSGEAGRGFAVVASEVKELAARTAEATDKVSEKISAIQGSTGTSVSALASIHKSIGELEQTAVSIASAVDQQSVASQDLARNIDSAASSADAVSTRLTKLNEMASETRTAASDVLESSHQLESQARTLKDTATAFLSSVLRSAESDSDGEAKAAA